MFTRSSVVAVVILVMLGGCHQRRSSELDPPIPAASPNRRAGSLDSLGHEGQESARIVHKDRVEHILLNAGL